MGSLSLDRYSYLFLDNFEANANISVAIQSGSTVAVHKAKIIDLVQSSDLGLTSYQLGSTLD